MGATHVTLVPGGYSSQRHWHSHEDEFVMVVSGELVLVTWYDACATVGWEDHRAAALSVHIRVCIARAHTTQSRP